MLQVYRNEVELSTGPSKALRRRFELAHAGPPPGEAPPPLPQTKSQSYYPAQNPGELRDWAPRPL